MDPAIASALIAGGAAALIAITSNWYAGRTNKRTIDAATETSARTLDAARGDKVWEKQAAVYVEAIAGIRHQQKIRVSRMQALRFLVPGRQELPSPVDWSELEPRLLAYASPAVIEALQAASDAGIKHRGLYDLYAAAIEQEREDEQWGNADAVGEAAVNSLAEADARDDALIALIRAELHARPSHEGELPRSIDSIYQPPDQ
jgi:hypothetical protein